MSEMIHETLRGLLCGLGDAIRDAVVSGRTHLDAARLSTVAGHAGGDTIYAIDKISEAAIVAWFRVNWPQNLPVQIVMEGLEDELCFPEGTAASATEAASLAVSTAAPLATVLEAPTRLAVVSVRL
jgi:hypothetical protein